MRRTIRAPCIHSAAPGPTRWLALTLVASAAHAQQAPQAAVAPTPAASDTPATAKLDTVTISATRRIEAIRDVPVAVTKISADAQLELGARDLTDMLSNVPGVTFDTRGTSDTGVVVIRGVTTGSLTNPTVGIYVDDVPIGGTSGVNNSVVAYDQRLLDLASIEILKGPQGTLYGASAMGGLLRYNTRIPEATFTGGQLGGEVSSTNLGGTNVMAYGNVNVPLSQGTAAMRAAVFYSYDGGYVDATGPAAGADINRGSVAGGRLSFALRPITNLDIRISAQTQNAAFDGQGLTSYSTSLQPIAGDLVRSNLLYREPFSRRDSLCTLNVDWNAGWGNVLAITGYQTMRRNNVYDANDGYLRLLPPFVTQTQAALGWQLDKFTQEFRLVSASGGAIEWVAGLFYASEKSDATTTLTASTAPGAP